MIKAIAWDIDGTLVDSEPLHQETLFGACRQWGADFSDLPVDHFRGMHMGAVWDVLKQRMPTHLTRDELYKTVIDLYIEGSGSLVPFAGTLETVKAFAAAGLPQVCVSNSGRRVVDANLKGLGIEPYIAFSISLDDVRNGKPDPEPYASACARLGLAPEQVLAVEDSVAGLTSARAAGLRTAFHAPEGGGAAEAGIIVSDLRELRGHVLTSYAASADA